MPEAYLRRALELAERHDFVIASDECYSEIYLDEPRLRPGCCRLPSRRGHREFERCVVFHSLSKRSSVPGLRSGFVAGDAALLDTFRLYRTYHGCAVPVHTQLASIPAWQDEAHVDREPASRTGEKFAAVVPMLARGARTSRSRPARSTSGRASPTTSGSRAGSSRSST